MNSSFIILLSLVTMFSFINVKYLKLPSTIGLMIQALFLALLVYSFKIYAPSLYDLIPHIERDIDFRDLLMNTMLSFLLFAGAMHIDIKELKSERKSVFLFATLGVLISTFLIGYSVYLISGLLGIDIPFLYALMFGAIVSPTDPIAVLGILKNYNVRKDIQMKIEGESLFNDGVGIVVFVSIMQIINTGIDNVSIADVSLLFLREAVGGILFGLLIGFIGFIFLKYTKSSPQTDIMITLVIASGGYALANLIEVSGALAMVSSGLYVGNKIHTEEYTEKTREYIKVFWNVLDEIFNGILFVLIGLFVLNIEIVNNNYLLAFMVVIAVLISRFISVTIPFYLIKKENKKNNWKIISILSWGGLRGGLGIALAMSIPPEYNGDLFVFIMFIIASFSILVQGLTIGTLVKKLGLSQK